MRPIFRAAIIAASLLLVLIILGSSSVWRGGIQAQRSTLWASSFLAASTQLSGYSRKLPPPPGSVKPVPGDPSYRSQSCTAQVTNISKQAGNQAESFVVINPTNPNNIVAFSNFEGTSSIFRAYSMDGGANWTRGTVATEAACCDGEAAFDTFGNLFLVYVSASENQTNIIFSTDGGVTFSGPMTLGTGDVDQPSVAVGNGSVWVAWSVSGNMVARGAPVTGLGKLGDFGSQQSIPNANGNYGGIAVGPGPNGGKVMVTYMDLTNPDGPATIYINVDADGLGAGGFGPSIAATTTNVGSFKYIPAQPHRSIDAEAGLVWDATGGPFNDRVYLAYTDAPDNVSYDTDIYLRTSTNEGMTWSSPVRVNDDPQGPIRSQFLPYLTGDYPHLCPSTERKA